MTALAQGTAGLALVMCFGLLATRQVGTGSVLLAIQSLAVAIAALAQHQPLIAAATAASNVIGARWLLTALGSDVAAGAAASLSRAKACGLLGRRQVELIGRSPVGPIRRQDVEPTEQADRPRSSKSPDQSSGRPIGRARLGIALGAGLAVLCQSSTSLALPLAVVLLSVLLAAERRHPLMRLMALVSLQNGIALAACLRIHPSLQGLACFVLPWPFATALAVGNTAGRNLDIPKWIGAWSSWMHLAVSLGLFVASLAVPLDPLAMVFAPLIAAGGLAEAWMARNRTAQSLTSRAAALAKLGFMLVAVAATQPVITWLAIVGTLAAAMLPALRRRWDGVLLAFCAAGLGFFGLLTIPSEVPSVSYTALFVGCATLVAVVPELGVVIVVVIMRLMMRAHPPPVAGTVLISVAIAGLLACSILLAASVPVRKFVVLRSAAIRTSEPIRTLASHCFPVWFMVPQSATAADPKYGGLRNHHTRLAWPRFRNGALWRISGPHCATLMQLALISIAAIAVGLDQPEARFAAAVLLILLMLTRIATRLSCGPAAAIARAGLAGIPPFGVFPGLVLILLTISREAAWLLLPVGTGLAAMLAAGVTSGRPAGFPSTWTWNVFRSLGLLPLALAFLIGFVAPDHLVDWLRMATAGVP